MEHLFANLSTDKIILLKNSIRTMVLAEAERAFVFGNLQSEEDNLIDRLSSNSFLGTWNKYKENILEPKLKEWGFGKEVELNIPD